MSSTTTALPSIDATLGAVFVGFSLACVVYGVLVTQVFSYFSRYPHDRLAFKLIVITLLVLETADQAFIGHLSYYYSISNYGRPDVLLKANVTWSLILQLTVGSVVGAIVKGSFGLRVWRFSGKNYFITGLIMLLVFGQLGLAIAFTIEAFKLPSVFKVHQLQTLGTVSLATGVATDVITAFALCYYLNKLRTGHRGSDSLVNGLVRYAINTGAVTSAVSLTTLLLFNFSRNDLYFISTYFVVSKLYAISYMATLNTRRTVSGRGTDQQTHSTAPLTRNNNTNLFHLGTRIPSMGPNDYRGWDSGKEEAFPNDLNFPMNTFAPPTKHVEP